MVDAIILAAGAGRRMGNVPKALVDLGDVSFLELVTRACREGGCQQVWAVVQPGSEVETLAARLDLTVARNAEPERGMFSSVIEGLRAALATTPTATGFLIFPVDHPRVRPTTVASILAAFAGKRDGTWIQPTTEDRGGHPIAVDAVSARALTGMEPTRTLREALESAGLTPERLPVDDPHIRENFNSPGDLPA